MLTLLPDSEGMLHIRRSRKYVFSLLFIAYSYEANALRMLPDMDACRALCSCYAKREVEARRLQWEALRYYVMKRDESGQTWDNLSENSTGANRRGLFYIRALRERTN